MRARTRDMFKRGFKTKGMIPLTTFLRVYKVGDIVDIKANAAQQKGMPHKYYHGYVSVPTLGMRAGDGVRERCARGALRRTMDGGRERFAARSKTDEKHWRASSGLPGSKAVDERQAETLGRPVAGGEAIAVFSPQDDAARVAALRSIACVALGWPGSRRCWTG